MRGEFAMGWAKIIFKNGASIVCRREGGDDKEATDSIISEIIQIRTGTTKDSFIHCHNGGGFDANEVVGVTTLENQVQETEGSKKDQKMIKLMILDSRLDAIFT